MFLLVPILEQYLAVDTLVMVLVVGEAVVTLILMVVVMVGEMVVVDVVDDFEAKFNLSQCCA